VKKYIAVGEMFCRSVIVLFLLAIVLPAIALGDLKTLISISAYTQSEYGISNYVNHIRIIV
jgi:hypothetical protein